MKVHHDVHRNRCEQFTKVKMRVTNNNTELFGAFN